MIVIVMKAKKKKKPKFNVMNLGFMKRVKERWRKPRGIDNKKRIRCRFAGASPRIGYKNAREVRGKHGEFRELLINNLAQLEAAAKEKKDVALRIASAVGKRKRTIILDRARELGIKVLNP